ncbi:Tfp pilus assembly protein FimT/FimU [Patescibacteria group bacterium]
MKGFTFIELLIVIAIMLVIAVAASPIYGNLMASSQLNENTSQIIQIVRTAREQSSAWLNDSAHGVYFNITEKKYILYQGDSYASRNTNYDRETSLDSSLSLSTTLSNNEINFSKGLGMPNNTGNITLSHDASNSRIITINSFGMTEQN